jgi:CO/xanthine dehydrogenase FAD-binding subunit
LGAKVKILGAGKESVIPLERFYTGKGDKVNILNSDEFITEVQIPALPSRSGGAYWKHSVRNVIDFPLLGAAAVVTLKDKEVCKDVRIVICGATSSPLRLKEAERVLKGKRLSSKTIQQAAEEAATKIRIISNGGRALSLNYRKKLIRGLVKKAVTEAFKQARSG